MIEEDSPSVYKEEYVISDYGGGNAALAEDFTNSQYSKSGSWLTLRQTLALPTKV
jgi:hypothetical protein